MMARTQAGDKIEGVAAREVPHRTIHEACLVEAHEERPVEEASLANILGDPRGTSLVDLEEHPVEYEDMEAD